MLTLLVIPTFTFLSPVQIICLQAEEEEKEVDAEKKV